MVEWDPKRAAANSSKHGIDFADGATALQDDLALTVEDDEHDEQRFVTIGEDCLGKLLVVIYSWPGDEPRLISARRATRKERKQYEANR